MANRGMSAAMLTEIAKSSVRLAHLVKLDLDTPVYLCNAYKDITYDSNVYQNIGAVLGIGTIIESLAMRVNKTSITISAVDQSFISTFLSTDISNREITIYFAFLDSAGDLVASPLEAYRGRIDQFSVKEDTSQGSAAISLTTSNHWAEWSKIAGRRTNSDDQQSYFPGDLGFDFSPEIMTDFDWGQA